jgi:hypothetical protein
MDKEDFNNAVDDICDRIARMLKDKNESYGDAALNPIRVFSEADSTEQIKVRIDDKLTRIYKGRDFGNEDTVEDLIGYLVLLKIAIKEENGK